MGSGEHRISSSADTLVMTQEMIDAHIAKDRATLPEPESAPELFDDEEVPTGPSCLACGGSYRILQETATGHRDTTCRWCEKGAQSASQIAKWHARSQGRPST